MHFGEVVTWCIAFSAVLTWLRLCDPSTGATTTRVTFGIARNAAPVFPPWSPFLTIPTLSHCAAIILSFAQQLRELGDICRNPRLVFGERFRRRPPLWLVNHCLIIEVILANKRGKLLLHGFATENDFNVA
jgi:hypothetical protein